MNTYKNKKYKTRDYETTNIVYCEAESNPDADKWVKVDSSENKLSQLWLEEGIRYYGYL